MRKVDAKLWRNYQILILPKISEAFGLKPSDRIIFIIDDSKVCLEKAVD